MVGGRYKRRVSEVSVVVVSTAFQLKKHTILAPVVYINLKLYLTN